MQARMLAAVSAALMLGSGAAFAATTMGKNAVLGPSGGDYLMKADEVTYDVNGKVVTAAGHVEIDHNDRILTAEKVTYDQNTDVVTASGNVVMMAPNGDVIFSNNVTLQNDMRDGVLEGFRALIGKNGRLAAVRATRKDANVMTMERGVFTPCKICNQPGQRTPVWDVKAYRVVYDETKHDIVYHDAILEMLGIPVFYTPYFSQADPTVKRETGLLAPEIGSSSALGTFVKLPLYVSLTDSQDFTIAPLISTHGGEVLEGEYRQRWDHGGMWVQASLANNPNGGLAGNQNETYSSLFGSGRIAVTDESWRVGFDMQLTSNPTYLERYNLYNKDDQLFSDLFVQGESGRSRFAITGYFFQSLIAQCPTTNPPTPCTPATVSPLFMPNGQIPLVLPLIEYTYIPERTILGGEFRFDLNSASISRRTGPDDQRATAEMHWQLPLVTSSGQLITLRADARGDIFHVNNNDPGALDLFGNPLPLKSHYLSRGLPYAGIDWRWPFISGGGEGKTALLVEPIVQAIAAPYGGNPKGIPDEDSTNIELAENDIFSFDRVPGYDIAETGPRANVGFRAEAIMPKGSIEVLIGEVLRLKPDPIFSTQTGLGGKASDIVGRFTIKFAPYLSLTHRVDIDQSSGNIRRNEVYLDGSWGRSSVELSYVRLPQQDVLVNGETREEANAQGTIALTDYWLVFAAARRDLANSQMLDDEFGLGYNDECLGISLSYRRQFTRDRDVPPSTSIVLGFHLWTGDQTDAEHVAQLFPRHLFSSTTL